MLTFSKAQELFEYDPDTGSLLWARAQGFVGAGAQAGGLINGTLYVTHQGRRYKAADIAWTLAHGRKPKKRLRYINGNRADIRACNLTEPGPARGHAAHGPQVGITKTRYGYAVTSPRGAASWRDVESALSHVRTLLEAL